MSEPIPLLDSAGWLERAAAARRPFHDKYYAMYSSIVGGIVTDPALMVVPVDDHMVHRGDAVFETFKCARGRIYNFPAHFARLLHSAEPLSLPVPWTESACADIIVQTTRAGRHPDALIRLLISRGPGSLGVSPYDCPASQMYVVISELPPPFMKTHPGGARARISAVPVKPSFFATVKSCNYLPNVLMKKEAVDTGVDFVFALDSAGHLAESATENVAVVTGDGRLTFPSGEHILSGTTMARVIDLARPLAAEGLVRNIAPSDITRSEMLSAAEILIVGTTPNVTAVVEFEGAPVGDGRPGPVYRRLSNLFERDLYENPRMHTPVFV